MTALSMGRKNTTNKPTTPACSMSESVLLRTDNSLAEFVS